jgi:hypothetical protein
MEILFSVSICTLMKVSDDSFLFLVSSAVHRIPLSDLKLGWKSYSYFSLSLSVHHHRAKCLVMSSTLNLSSLSAFSHNSAEVGLGL